jgi:peptidase C39-like protein
LRRTFTRAALIIAAVAGVPAAYPSVSAAQPAAVSLLDVPYLPQSEALCGGAAIAMVMRFWGVTGVYAETFTDLVDREAGGITGEDLLRALQTRGFDAASRKGDAALVQSAIAARRPLIALIEDRPGRFHYVVIVGWHDGRVIVHDPARAPFRVLDEVAFTRAWSQSNHWTLDAAPHAGAVAAAIREPASDRGTGAGAGKSGALPAATVCSRMVEEGVRVAGAGDLEVARHVLETAAANCPSEPDAWRELAGVHALRGEWREAASDARRALDRDGRDRHAARILATSLYVEGDDAQALDAWNRLGEPAIDLIDIQGLDRTRFAIVASALRLQPETLLTRDALERGRRRLDALPSVVSARLSYRPGEDGRAQITAAVVERPVTPSGVVALGAIGVRALTDREFGIAVASPTGGGELWSLSWRWWNERPRVALGVAAPAPFGGLWSLEAADDRQAYGVDIQERRRGVTLTITDWMSGAVRWSGAAAVERWPAGTTTAIAGGLERRAAGDRMRTTGRVGLWMGATRTWTLRVSGEWRSTLHNQGSALVAAAGFDVAAQGSPMALWPGAGTGHGREPLLRAHPLLDAGVIRGGVFGRRLVHSTVEWRRWTAAHLGTLRLAPAVFVDVAHAADVPYFADRRAHMDAGAGLRIAVPTAGVLRLDLARGVRDGEMALSVGWTR